MFPVLKPQTSVQINYFLLFRMLYCIILSKLRLPHWVAILLKEANVVLKMSEQTRKLTCIYKPKAETLKRCWRLCKKQKKNQAENLIHEGVANLVTTTGNMFFYFIWVRIRQYITRLTCQNIEPRQPNSYQGKLHKVGSKPFQPF